MALPSGTRLGPYEIGTPLGAGGMGEVYRARDTRLKRDVAVKILPESFATDPERLARFQREAEVLAALNHPHIAAIYGLEEGSVGPPGGGHSVRALVLELVDGETLADRIARGPIPADEALPIARQMAEALEAAHERGIIHRDLKPSNVAFTKEGQVKVLDFGLAKLTEASAAGSAAVSNSPTITSPALMTGAGALLGTAAYMSPEQAKGREADKRSDIWAFGCVLYEMLTGRRAFDGEDVSDTLAAVLRGDPDWTALPSGAPTAVRILLDRCLVKDRRKRIGDISTALFLLDESAQLSGPAEAGPHVRTGHDVRGDSVQAVVWVGFSRPDWRRGALVGAAAVAVVAAIVGGAVWRSMRPVPPSVVRTAITAESAALDLNDLDRDIAITPDGSRIVYRGTRQLRVRALDQLEPAVLSGLGAPRGVFIAPDGQWVGFFDGLTMLKKVAITGGPPVALCVVVGNPRGATWGEDGTVIFATSSLETGLQRVSAAGGEVTVLTKPDQARGEVDHRWPEFLPGGEAVLFTIDGTGGLENSQIAVLDLRTNTQKVLVRGGSHAQYVSTGHLVYGTGGTLRAVGFDLARLEVVGTPVPVLERVVTTGTGAVDAVVAANGTLVYVAGTSALAGTLSTLAWLDRAGAVKPLTDRHAMYRAPRISPDGLRVAVSILAPDGNEDIWVIDAERGTQTRLTSEQGVDSLPLWTPDGKRITFSSNRTNVANALYWVAADGSGAPEALTQATANQGATSWSADGSTLAFYDVGSGYDLFTLKPGASPVRFLGTPFQEQGPAFSPDGRWLAHSSNETGRPEIYVAPYPGPGGKIAISSTGGRSPRWSSNGRELFYRNGRQMMVVAVVPGTTLSVGTARVLFEGDFVEEQTGQGAHNYDVAGDGRRFIMMAPVPQKAGETAPPQIVLVQHWTEELKRLVPVN